MAFQEFELNMIPHGDMPSFYASQYETGRPIIIDVLMGEDAFDCSELFIELHCRKVDDNIVTLEPDSVDGNQVTFVGTEQLFACPGKNLCEVCLYADDTKDTSLGSLNFFIEVEPDPLAGGLTSETQIHDLYQQVEEITQQVIGDDYYDKTEVDDLLDDKADKSTTYTKTQVDSALALKADTATTYTKTQVDNALALKANTADLATVATTGDYDDLTNKPTIPAAQVQSDWDQSDNTKVDYIKNKPDLSVYVTSDDLGNIIYDLLPAGTASGAVANFETEVGGVPLVDCKANIVATGGNGTPDNPNPINGYTEANITRCGVNLFDKDGTNILNGYIGSSAISASGVMRVVYSRCKPLTQYTVSKTAGQRFSCGYTKELPNIGVGVYGIISANTASSISITTGADAKYFVAYVYNGNVDTGTADEMLASVQIAEGTDTPYHAYNGQTYTIAFGQTVYGGVLDVTRGVLTITHANIASYNGESINEPWLSSMDVYTPGGTPTTGAQVVYPLTTPFDIDLTPEVISAIVGTNNVYSDTNGDTEVQYKDSIQHYIDSRV